MALGFANTFVGLSQRADPVLTNVIPAQLAEIMVVPFVSFGCLAVAWPLVAVGMQRQA